MEFEPRQGLYRNREVAGRPLLESMASRYDLWRRLEMFLKRYDTEGELIHSGMIRDLS